VNIQIVHFFDVQIIVTHREQTPQTALYT